MRTESWNAFWIGNVDAGRRTDVGLRQIESERAAGAGDAAELNFTAEQAGEFAADRKTKAGAAVLAAGAGIGLLEGFEDDALFFRRNADAGVGDFEGDDRCGALENRMIARSSRRRQAKPTDARCRVR